MGCGKDGYNTRDISKNSTALFTKDCPFTKRGKGISRWKSNISRKVHITLMSVMSLVDQGDGTRLRESRLPQFDPNCQLRKGQNFYHCFCVEWCSISRLTLQRRSLGNKRRIHRTLILRPIDPPHNPRSSRAARRRNGSQGEAGRPIVVLLYSWCAPLREKRVPSYHSDERGDTRIVPTRVGEMV